MLSNASSYLAMRHSIFWNSFSVNYCKHMVVWKTQNIYVKFGPLFDSEHTHKHVIYRSYVKKLLNVQSTLNRKNSRCSNFISKRNDLLQLVLHWAIFSAIYRLNVGNIVTLWIRSLNNCCKKKATILDESQGVLL